MNATIFPAWLSTERRPDEIGLQWREWRGINFAPGMQLARITIFPIKSLDGVAVESARITRGGILENDRVHAIYDAEGKVVNGKRTARVHELRCAFDDKIREVRLWPNAESSPKQFSLDSQAPIEQWLSEFFGFRRHPPPRDRQGVSRRSYGIWADDCERGKLASGARLVSRADL